MPRSGEPNSLQISEGYRRAQRAYFERPVLHMAPLLLGSILVHEHPDGTVAIRLTEVEAYGGGIDPGSHSFRGQTARNATMFGPPGHLYCYFTYGMHHAINIVCDGPGIATGCLLRGGEVVVGHELAHTRREVPAGRERARRKAVTDEALARGPGNLAQALAATRAATDGADLCDPASGWSLMIPDVQIPLEAIQSGPRTGVSGEGGDAQRFPWRFYLPGEPSVSPYRPAATRAR